MRELSLRNRLLLIALSAVLILALVAIVVSDSDGASCGRINWADFREKGAAETGPDGTSKRQRLADQVLECGALEGKSKQWVERRLGRGGEWRGSERGRVDYRLGLCTEERSCFFPGDTEVLRLQYDNAGRVESVEQFST